MDGARGQFLARAALAHDQHMRVGAPGTVEHGQEPLHGAARPLHHRLDLVLRHRTAQHAVLAAQSSVLGRPAEDLDQLRHAEGLGDVVEGLELERLDGRLDLRVPGHDDDLGVVTVGAHGLEHLDAITPGDPEIQEDDVEVFAGEHGQGLLAVGNRGDREARSFQATHPGFAEVGVVLDNQKARGAQRGSAVHR
jgi:hypothetical protein